MATPAEKVADEPRRMRRLARQSYRILTAVTRADDALAAVTSTTPIARGTRPVQVKPVHRAEADENHISQISA